jgi:hypothetical protein
MDPLLQGLFRMRVFTYDEKSFKFASLDALRESNVYKQLKLKPIQIQQIERNLVQEHLSPLTFTALCALYSIDVTVLQPTHHFVCGRPTYSLRGLTVERVHNVHTYQFTPTKPLYAMSHYTSADLQAICTKLKLPSSTRAVMYAAISDFVSSL